MTYETALTWSWLHVLTKRRYDMLCQVFGDLDTALEHLDGEMLRRLGCRNDTVEKTLVRKESFDPGRYGEELRKRSVEFCTIEGELYPAALKDLPDPPVFLYWRGDINILHKPCIGLVGTRNMSSYGRRVVEAFVPPIVYAGITTVSGLAQGVGGIL